MNFSTLSDKLDGFDKHYRSELKPVLDELEVKRKQASSIFFKVLSGLILILVPLATVINDSDTNIFLAVGAFFICGYFYNNVRKVRKEAKQQVLEELSKFLEIEYQVKPNSSVINDYKGLSLIPSYDEQTLEDGFAGIAEGVDFNLFEANLVNVSRDKDGKKSRTTVFRGLLAKFDFHKDFAGTTIIKNDMTGIGNFLTGWSNKGNRVKLEDPDFERKFEVYSTDQIEARYLLTPAFMERILHLTRLLHVNKVRLAFDKGALLMAFDRNKDSFEGGRGDLNDPSYVSNIIADLSIIFDTVRKLKLDQKSKI